MTSWIIKTEVCVICRSRRLRQVTLTQGFNNSWYSAKTEFNNCFIIHLLNNRQKKTFICWKIADKLNQDHLKILKYNNKTFVWIKYTLIDIIHPQKQKRSIQPFCFWEEHSKGLSDQADVELDMINAISAADICSRYCIYHVKFTSYCELIECSRPIRFFIVSLMYNNWYLMQCVLSVTFTSFPKYCVVYQ